MKFFPESCITRAIREAKARGYYAEERQARPSRQKVGRPRGSSTLQPKKRQTVPVWRLYGAELW